MRTTARTLALIAAVLLAGCAGEEPPPVAAKPAAPPPPRSLVDASSPVAGMGKAVSTAKTGAAVELRYEILSKPVVGTPFDVDIAIVSGAAAEVMTVVVAGMPGLTVTNEVVPPVGEVAAGQVTNHRFTALVDQPGVYYVSVTATTLFNGTTLARTFSIPVLLGDPNAPRESTAEPPTDATGQPIESMPARETTR